MKIFVPISKVDVEKRMVYGYASTEAIDSQGERVSKVALEKALPDYMRFANVREMHQPSAVGVTKEAEVDGKGLYIGVKVVDDTAWNKVKETVYKGFSIGGKMLQKVDDIITELTVSEISLVDRPANPEAVFDVWKAEAVRPVAEAMLNELAALVDQKAVPLPALLGFAKSYKATADEPAKEVKKGMYTVAMAAQLMDQLASLQASTAYEAEAEKDGSPIPEQLRMVTTMFGEALKALVSEEVDEIVAGSAPVMAMAVAVVDLHKITDKAEAERIAIEILKASKCSSQMQKIHDHCVSVGAKCGAGKAAGTENLEKVEYAFESTLGKVEGLTTEQAGIINKAVQTIVTERDVLKKKVTEFEAQPAPARGKLKVVEKSNDLPTETAGEVAPVMKNGIVDDVATAIKKAQQNPIPVLHAPAAKKTGGAATS